MAGLTGDWLPFTNIVWRRPRRFFFSFGESMVGLLDTAGGSTPLVAVASEFALLPSFLSVEVATTSTAAVADSAEEAQTASSQVDGTPLLLTLAVFSHSELLFEPRGERGGAGGADGADTPAEGDWTVCARGSAGVDAVKDSGASVSSLSNSMRSAGSNTFQGEGRTGVGRGSCARASSHDATLFAVVAPRWAVAAGWSRLADDNTTPLAE